MVAGSRRTILSYLAFCYFNIQETEVLLAISLVFFNWNYCSQARYCGINKLKDFNISAGLLLAVSMVFVLAAH
jgi:hypothetical protein